VFGSKNIKIGFRHKDVGSKNVEIREVRILKQGRVR
jgi:hypothetical protein